MQIDLSHFFKKTETIEETITLIQSCAILLAIAGGIEVLLAVFLKNVLFPGILTMVLGGILYFVTIPSVGMVCFWWSIVPVIGAFSTRFGTSIIESLYALFSMAPLIVSFRASRSTRRLQQLRFPDENEEESKDVKNPLKATKQRA